MWLAAGALAFIMARVLRPRRTERWRLELVLSVIVALSFGIAATFLDFGGWNELDWRAGLFAFLTSFAAVGVLRAIRR